MPSEEKLLRYQSGRISAELSGSLNGVEFSADLSIDEMAGDSIRGFRLEMSAPESLCGVTFERSRDGSLAFSVGEVRCELDRSSADAVEYLIDAFSIEGDALGISAISGEEAGIFDCERITRLDFSDYTLYIDASTSLPVKIEGARYSLSVRVEIK